MREAMCSHCRRSDGMVADARDNREPCPHCGRALWEEPARCCMPECREVLSLGSRLPLCRDCGIKVAVAHFADAELLDAVHAEQARRQQARRERTTRNGVVYYVQIDPQRIKIGYTSNLKARLSALRLQPSSLLAMEPGDSELERERHRQFGGERIVSNREDFAPSERLLEWIDQTREAHGLPREATLPDTKTVTRRRV